MANGYTGAATNGSFTVRFRWESSYDAASNTSSVTVTPQIYNTTTWGGNLYACGYAVSGAGVYLNGALNYAFDGTWGTNGNLACAANVNAWTDMSPRSSYISPMTVRHDALGNGSCTVRFCGTIVPGNHESTRTKIDTGTVTISLHENAASSISSSAAGVVTQGRFSLTMERRSPTNYHIATFRCGSAVLYTSDRFDTALEFTVPRAWFADYPDRPALAATVSVQTYDRSGTAVGSPASAALTVTADAGMKPAVSAGWARLAPLNTGAAAAIAGYIKGYSKAEAVFDSALVDMSATFGAHIASFSVTCQGVTDSSTYRTPVLSSPSVEVVCTVTDSRGRSAGESFALAVMDYAKPAFGSVEIFRCDENGVQAEDGTHYSAKASVLFSPLGGQNSIALSSAAAVSGGSYGAEEAMTAGAAHLSAALLSADASGTVRLSVSDALGNSAVYYRSLPTRKWAMKFRPDGNGVAFGKAAEYDGVFEIAGGWQIRGQGLFDAVYPVGSIYMSVSSADPATLFGGVWERLEDRFLLGAGTVCAAGATGGEREHTLSVDEMPSHTHRLYGADNDPPDWFGGSGNTYGIRPRQGQAYDYLEYVGGGAAHNNMPPYLAVYMWKRTG